MQVKRFDVEALERDRDQLWAEAAAREASGASIRLPEELWPAAASAQQEREIENPFLEVLDQTLRWREVVDGKAWPMPMQGKITSEDVWQILQLPPPRRTQQFTELRQKAMKQLGWEHKRLRIEGVPTYCYIRGEPEGDPPQHKRILVDVVSSGEPGLPPTVTARPEGAPQY